MMPGMPLVNRQLAAIAKVCPFRRGVVTEFSRAVSLS